MTYRNCKKLIDNKIKAGEINSIWAAEMLNKLDMFLLANRITNEHYQELSGMINNNLIMAE